MQWEITNLETKMNCKIKRNAFSFGLDCALIKTGWLYLKTDDKNIYLISSGVIDTNKDKAITYRLDKLCNDLSLIIIDKSTSVVIEEPFIMPRNISTGLIIAHAVGAAYRELKQKAEYVFFLRAVSARKRIGMPKCNVKKPVVHEYIKNIFNFEDSPDIVDAFALAMAGVISENNIIKSKSLTKLKKKVT